jgi:hypothetical protein
MERVERPTGADGSCLEPVNAMKALDASRVPINDVSREDILRLLREGGPLELSLVVTERHGSQDVVAMVRLHSWPSNGEPAIWEPAPLSYEGRPQPEPSVICPPCASPWRAHAAERWARAVVPMIDAPADPRTVGCWSRCVGASPGAIRNWCRTLDIGVRCSLVFGRLLRAVALSDGGRHLPANVLDIVDRRTLAGMLASAGLATPQFPRSIDEFLELQTLVRDPVALHEVQRAFAARPRRRDSV